MIYMKYLIKKTFFLFLIFSLPLGKGWGWAQEYKVKFGSVIPKDSPWETGVKEYTKEAESKAGGRLLFKMYLAGMLGGEVEMIKSISMGTLDAGAFSTASIAEALSMPELQVFEMPFLFNSDEEADAVMDAMFDKMSELLLKKNVVLIMWGTNGWRSFGTKSKAVTKPSDLKGMKMRAQESAVYENFLKSLGATPVPIATPDVLVSLKTGMVDGFDQTPIFSVSTGWITAVKNFTVTKHIYQPGAVLLSKKFYDKLPDDLKKVILASDKRKELQVKSRAAVRKDDEEVLANLSKNFGTKVVTLNEQQRGEFKKATQSVYTNLEPKIGKEIMQMVNGEIAKFRGKK